MELTAIIKLIADYGALLMLSGLFIWKYLKDESKTEITPKHDNRLNNIEASINLTLRKLLDSTCSDKAFVIRFHNGDYDMIGNSIRKMTMTNEVVHPGVKPVSEDFRGVLRSNYYWADSQLREHGQLFIHDIETLRGLDESLYLYFKETGVKAAYYASLRNKYDVPIGIIGISYSKRNPADLEQIKHCLHDKKMRVEAVLEL